MSEANQKAIRKGQRHTTIMTNLESGCVIDPVEERTTEATLRLLALPPFNSVIQSLKHAAIADK